MTEAELVALLDAHDGLLRACVDELLAFPEFLASYGSFYESYALDGDRASAQERGLLKSYADRISFHRRVAAIIARAGVDSIDPVGSGVERFMLAAAKTRLRQLVSEFPAFKAPPLSAA